MIEKSTNLQFMRFVAACLVIFSHSFAITQGSGENEWLWKATNGQLDLGAVAVAIFFLCSGYLIARSLEKRKVSFMEFFIARAKRIIPPLLFVVICSVLVGACISTFTVKDYFTNLQTYRYLLNGIMVLQHELPGVFEEAKYASTVNGALWTLPVEFLCYIACYVAWKMEFLKKKKILWTIPLVISASIVIYVLGIYAPILRAVIRPCLLFYIGIIFCVYRDVIKLNKHFLVFCIIGILACTLLEILEIGMLVFFPYAMIMCWFYNKQHFQKLSVLGKYSYAMYLWGFPVQQFAAERFSWNLSPYTDAVISLIVSFILAVITYYLVENPFSSKSKFARIEQRNNSNEIKT